MVHIGLSWLAQTLTCKGIAAVIRPDRLFPASLLSGHSGHLTIRQSGQGQLGLLVSIALSTVPLVAGEQVVRWAHSCRLSHKFLLTSLWTEGSIAELAS